MSGWDLRISGDRRTKMGPVTGKRILTVDDDPRALRMLARCLRADRHEVFSAENGRDALRIIQEHKVELAILDWSLPDTNGTELAFRIKAEGFDIPIIVLTGFKDTVVADSRVEDFVDWVMEKPAICIWKSNSNPMGSIK